MKNLASAHRPITSQYRDTTYLTRPTPLPSILLDAQRHIVEIRDRADDTTRQYVIETKRDTRNQYNYAVTFKPKWQTIEQHICVGTQFASPDLAIEDALVKIEAWERWLDASQPRET